MDNERHCLEAPRDERELHSNSAVERLVMPYQTTRETSRFKFSGMAWMKNRPSDDVINAAIDWKNFQSAENANALYFAVLRLLGEEPHIPFELD